MPALSHAMVICTHTHTHTHTHTQHTHTHTQREREVHTTITHTHTHTSIRTHTAYRHAHIHTDTHTSIHTHNIQTYTGKTTQQQQRQQQQRTRIVFLSALNCVMTSLCSLIGKASTFGVSHFQYAKNFNVKFQGDIKHNLTNGFPGYPFVVVVYCCYNNKQYCHTDTCTSKSCRYINTQQSYRWEIYQWVNTKRLVSGQPNQPLLTHRKAFGCKAGTKYQCCVASATRLSCCTGNENFSLWFHPVGSESPLIGSAVTWLANISGAWLPDLRFQLPQLSKNRIDKNQSYCIN